MSLAPTLAPTLVYVTFLARDVAALAQFYVDALGLEEVLASRDERYREVRGGGCMIGFATQAVRPFIKLPEIEPVGTRAIVTFDVGTVAQVAVMAARAVAQGATLVREGQDTFFGQHQAVLSDPEGNVFRLSAASGS
ncbi:VOC family protein [Novosphingobium soli]|uniref:VOC family protein n=1 Tax=Novosphingobium soli TaxID=574956 RepID=A0ABV6CV78_9SPHN